MKKNKKKTIYISIFLMLFLLIGSLVYLSIPEKVSIVHSQDASGVIEQKLTKCGFICQIFHPTQQAFFKSGFYYVGDSITVQERLTIGKDQCLLRGQLVSIQQIIYKSGSEYKRLPEMYHKILPMSSTMLINPAICPETYTYAQTTTFTPTEAGIYSIKTNVLRQKDLLPRLTECSADPTNNAEKCAIVVNAKVAPTVSTSATPDKGLRYCEGNIVKYWDTATLTYKSTDCSTYMHNGIKDVCVNGWCEAPSGNCVYQGETILFGKSRCFGTTNYVCGPTIGEYGIYYKEAACGYEEITTAEPPASTAKIADCKAKGYDAYDGTDNVCFNFGDCVYDFSGCDVKTTKEEIPTTSESGEIVTTKETECKLNSDCDKGYKCSKNSCIEDSEAKEFKETQQLILTIGGVALLLILLTVIIVLIIRRKS